MNPIPRRLQTAAACLFISTALAAVGGCRRSETPAAAPVGFSPPATGALTGAYIDFGEREDEVTLEAIERFEAMVGHRQGIVASSSYWGEQSFPTRNLAIVRAHGAVPLVFWSPWDRPYAEEKGPDRFSLTAILDGKWDAYIDRWAEGARAHGGPILVSFCNEMNGNWFPWSGIFYGAGTPAANGEGPAGPATFKRAWRYVVERVRARGASNVQWVFHVINYGYPQEAWNQCAAYYPGADVVDWLGMSVYGKQFVTESWSPFAPLLDWPYREICALDPDKPVMVAEWGVGEYPDAGDKAAWIRDGFAEMARRPRIKAAVFWHERWENADGTFSNLRVNSSPAALKAYREGVASPHWLPAAR